MTISEAEQLLLSTVAAAVPMVMPPSAFSARNRMIILCVPSLEAGVIRVSMCCQTKPRWSPKAVMR